MSDAVAVDPQAGFALADALTGLTILAATVILSINAAAIARRASLSALEHREAARAVDYLLATTFEEEGARSGDLSAPWRASLTTDTRLAGSDAAAPCRRWVSVAPRGAGRTYAATSLEPCPAPAR
jgi:hypothetical protein